MCLCLSFYIDLKSGFQFNGAMVVPYCDLLDILTIGLVNDKYAENSNDDYKEYKEVASQEDFDKS